MPSRRGSIVKVSPFVPAPVETTVKPAPADKPAPAELAAAFAKLKTAKPDFPYDGQPDREVVAVDPYSTGACVAAAAAKRGFKIIHVMSAPDSGTMEEMVPKHLRGLSYIATLRADEALPFAERAKSLAAELRKACAGQQKGTKGKGKGGWRTVTLHPHPSAPPRHPSLPAPLPAPFKLP